MRRWPLRLSKKRTRCQKVKLALLFQEPLADRMARLTNKQSLQAGSQDIGSRALLYYWISPSLALSSSLCRCPVDLFRPDYMTSSFCFLKLICRFAFRAYPSFKQMISHRRHYLTNFQSPWCRSRPDSFVHYVCCHVEKAWLECWGD